MIKYIFKPIHLVLGKLILFIDWITRPKPIRRSPEEQKQIDVQASHMALYHYPMCPYCVGTRRQMYRLGLNMDLRDPRNDPQWMTELVEQGGKKQVPCLRIDNGNGSVEWLYESEDIMKYLDNRFGKLPA